MIILQCLCKMNRKFAKIYFLDQINAERLITLYQSEKTLSAHSRNSIAACEKRFFEFKIAAIPCQILFYLLF